MVGSSEYPERLSPLSQQPVEGNALPIYIIHYDAPDWCDRSIESLLATDGQDIEITVVHNGGPTPTSRAGVRFVEPSHNVGFAGGANIALRLFLEGHSQHVLIASHDLLVNPDTISGLLAAAHSHQNWGVVGPLYRDPLHTRSLTVIPPSGSAVPTITGACMLISRRCVEQVGLFDEDFSSYIEDVDYCRRTWKAGLEVHVADTYAETIGTRSPRATSMATANWMLYDFKHSVRSTQRVRIQAQILASYFRTTLAIAAPWRSAQARESSAGYRGEWERVLRATRRSPKV